MRASELSAADTAVILQGLRGHVPSLLVAACVNRTWRHAITGDYSSVAWAGQLRIGSAPGVFPVVVAPSRAARLLSDARLARLIRLVGAPNLEHLDLRGCRRLTDAALAPLSAAGDGGGASEKLRSADFTGCRRLSGPGITAALGPPQRSGNGASRRRICLERLCVDGVGLFPRGDADWWRVEPPARRAPARSRMAPADARALLADVRGLMRDSNGGALDAAHVCLGERGRTQCYSFARLRPRRCIWRHSIFEPPGARPCTSTFCVWCSDTHSTLEFVQMSAVDDGQKDSARRLVRRPGAAVCPRCGSFKCAACTALHGPTRQHGRPHVEACLLCYWYNGPAGHTDPPPGAGWWQGVGRPGNKDRDWWNNDDDCGAGGADDDVGEGWDEYEGFIESGWSDAFPVFGGIAQEWYQGVDVDDEDDDVDRS